jgi:HAD superfamily hydrolase (TIGR01509 family)
MGCGTGSIREIALKTLKTLALDDLFTVLVTADDVVHPKPAPDTFLQCAEALGVVPEYCQVFEDGDSGLEAARAAGMIATDIRPYV